MASYGTPSGGGGGSGFAKGAGKGAAVGTIAGPVGTVAGALIGGYFGNKASKRASKVQQQSTDAALEYQKGRDALADKHYNDAWADYQARHAAWEKRNFGDGAAAKATGGGGGMSAVPVPTLADLNASQQDVSAATQAAQPTLADVGEDWTNWRRYGA